MTEFSESTLRLALCLLALGVAQAAVASGSTSQRPIGPGLGTGHQAPPVEDTYERGRRVYLRRIACDNCPMPDGIADDESARALLTRVQSGEFDLGRRDARALQVFVKRRWRLR